MRKIIVKPLLIILMLFVFGLGTTTSALAQCAMCKAAAESNIKEQTNNYGVGLNKGILYLLSMPYILGGVGICIWYRHRKQYKS